MGCGGGAWEVTERDHGGAHLARECPRAPVATSGRTMWSRRSSTQLRLRLCTLLKGARRGGGAVRWVGCRFVTIEHVSPIAALAQHALVLGERCGRGRTPHFAVLPVAAQGGEIKKALKIENVFGMIIIMMTKNTKHILQAGRPTRGYKLAAPRKGFFLPPFFEYNKRLLRQKTGGACLYMPQDGHWLASFEVIPPQKLVFPRPKK